MTRFFVTGHPDWWHVFWVLATWSASYLIAAAYLREKFGEPQSLFERYWLWFGRVVGIVGASIIFAYGYRTTGELDKLQHVEEERDHWRALAETKAQGVNDATYVALRSMELKNGMCVEWEHENGGRNRPVSVTNRRTYAGGNRIQSSSATDDRSRGSVDCLPRGEPGITTGTDGNGRTF